MFTNHNKTYLVYSTKLQNYFELTKPKIWYLLVFTAFGAAFTASSLFDVSINYFTWALLLVGITAGSAAANTLTGYNDRDIDTIMDRTKNRPIPSGRISPKNALIFGLVLAGLSLACSWFINIWAFGLMAFGLFDNIIIYSKWLKRKSWANIIFGGFSGAAPALIGNVTVTFQHMEIGVLMASLVFFWIPPHIWSLALHIKKDYLKASIPMLPVISSEKKSIQIIAATTIMMVLFSIVPFIFLNQFGMIYLGAATIFGLAITLLSFWLLIKPNEKSSWILFKFTSPYLAVLFVAFMIDAFLF